MHHMMDGDGATPNEKVFRKQRCLCNSSQTECNDNRRCRGSRGACVAPLSGRWCETASKEKVFRKQRCLHNSSLVSTSATTTTDAASLGDGPGGARCRTCGVSIRSAVCPVLHPQAAAAAGKPQRGRGAAIAARLSGSRR